MLRIGLTGGIGAGKSTVAGLLAAHGAEIIDADAIAREVVAPGEPLLTDLAEVFGSEIIDADGSLDRARLAGAAFADEEATATLGALMHPVIRDRTAARFSASTAEVVVHDVPLLVENHMEVGYHLTLLVDVPAELRLTRLVETRGMDRADAEARIARQAGDEERRAACDVLIDNTGTVAQAEAAVDDLWTRRLRPFAENLAAGRPAARTTAIGSPREGDDARLLAKLRHGLGEDVSVEVLGADADSAILLAISLPEPTAAEAIKDRLAALGFPPETDLDPQTTPDPLGPPQRFGSADPGLRAEVRVNCASAR